MCIHGSKYYILYITRMEASQSCKSRWGCRTLDLFHHYHILTLFLITLIHSSLLLPMFEWYNYIMVIRMCQLCLSYH